MSNIPKSWDSYQALSICRFPAHDCSGYHGAVPIVNFPPRLVTMAPEAEQTVVGVPKGGTGFSGEFFGEKHRCSLNQWPFQDPKLEVPTIYKA